MIFALNNNEEHIIMIDIYDKKHYRFIKNILNFYNYHTTYYVTIKNFPVFLDIDPNDRTYNIYLKSEVEPILDSDIRISFLDFLKRLNYEESKNRQ